LLAPIDERLVAGAAPQFSLLRPETREYSKDDLEKHERLELFIIDVMILSFVDSGSLGKIIIIIWLISMRT
jgi:hypothetical protein